MTAKEFLNRTPGRIGFLIFSIALGVWSFHGFVDLTRQTHTRAVERDFAAAVDELQKSPPGVQRAEVFLKRLKAIDPGYAPAEVKTALHDYISADEQGMDALKAGRDTKQYDSAMAEARERLIASLKKWD